MKQAEFYFFRTIFVLVVLSLQCCSSDKPEADFYYWKTTFNLSQKEWHALKHFKTQKLYTRFFDVDKEEDLVVPLATLQGLKSAGDSVEIVPVVFITNRTFINSSVANTKELAQLVFKKIKSLSNEAAISVSEIQFDCDWSDATQMSYFEFLKEIRLLAGEKIILNATVRLHQVKYKTRTGVPPVDKAVIMFYNIGNVKVPDSGNSILNRDDASNYVHSLKDYPLQYSVALPLFRWIAHYRDGKLTGLISKDNAPDLNHKAQIKITSRDHYRVTASFLNEGRYYREGDELKQECVNHEVLRDVARLIGENSNEQLQRIIFYDLDEFNFKTYTYENLEETISAVR